MRLGLKYPDLGLANNRRMHAVLEEMRIAHGYQEFDDIAHNLRLLSEQVKQENFAFATRPFKPPPER